MRLTPQLNVISNAFYLHGKILSISFEIQESIFLEFALKVLSVLCEINPEFIPFSDILFTNLLM